MVNEYNYDACAEILAMVFNVLLTLFFSIFSTAILSYISMAVMIGPWINSVIVIGSSLILMVLKTKAAHTTHVKSVSLITAGSSLGGILATGCGFAFPTLYFLDPTLFNQWLQTPWYFITVMAAIALSAGALGLLIADFFEHSLINEAKLPFPVGEVSYALASVQENIANIVQLIAGTVTSIIYSLGAYFTAASRTLVVMQPTSFMGLTIPALGIPVHEFPLLVSIGYIAGSIVMIPLIVGIISKILFMNPAYDHFFSYVSYNDFSFAFISGMVMYGALMSLLELPKFFSKLFKKFMKEKTVNTLPSMQGVQLLPIMVVLLFVSAVLFWFKFSLIMQLYIILFTALCTYQLLVIGGELGLAPVGRFATFVMIPAMMIFSLNAVHLTVISTFVEICGGVAVDVLFGRKMAQLSELQTKKVRRFQWFGLVVSSATVGIFFWLLISKFGLGSSPLIAQRSHMRALQTLNFQNLDFYAMVLGALYGTLLKDFKISPIMVLGGILMPLDSVLALVLGGSIASMIKDSKKYDLFWSGIFATTSISMIIRAIVI